MVQAADGDVPAADSSGHVRRQDKPEDTGICGVAHFSGVHQRDDYTFQVRREGEHFNGVY